MASASTERCLPTINRGAGGLVAAGSIRLSDDHSCGTISADCELAVMLAGKGGGGGDGGGSSSCGGSGGGGVGGDRRTLRGVGTYLIDTPKDTAQQLRQRFLTYQEQHRGLVKSQNEILPDIPFRLHPRTVEVAQTTPVDRRSPMQHVEMATSPLFAYDEDSPTTMSPEPVSPDPSCTLHPTFLTAGDDMLEEHVSDQMTSLNLTEVGDAVKTCRDQQVTSSANVKDLADVSPLIKMTDVTEKPKPKIVAPIARSVSFSERPPPRRPPPRPPRPKKLQAFPRLILTPKTPNTIPPEIPVPIPVQVQSPSPILLSERLFTAPPVTDRSPRGLDSAQKRKSSSMSDLTDNDSIFSWHDKEFERKTTWFAENEADHFGPTSFFQAKKSHSLLDLLKPASREGGPWPNGEECPLPKHRLSSLAVGKKGGNSLRHSGLLTPEEASREWRNIVHTQVIDHADYDRYASRRKPTTPSVKKRPVTRSHSPKSSRQLKYAHADNGKLYPMFVNVGSHAKKIGRSLHSRKQLKYK